MLPGPLAPHGVPRTRSARDDFDALALGLFEGLEGRWGPQLFGVELGVEEAPVLDDWGADTVPLASLTRGRGGRPTRIVLFRQPLELRSDDRVQLTALVHRVLVEQVSELLGVPPAEVDPRYEEEE